jgi:hypothetical protein
MSVSPDTTPLSNLGCSISTFLNPKISYEYLRRIHKQAHAEFNKNPKIPKAAVSARTIKANSTISVAPSLHQTVNTEKYLSILHVDGKTMEIVGKKCFPNSS